MEDNTRDDHVNYNFKTPEFSGEPQNGNGGTYQNNTDGQERTYGDRRDNENGRDQRYDRIDYSGQNKQGRTPHKRGLGRELGVFAIKCCIAAVIGTVVLGLAGTIALNATKKNVYIVDQKSAPNSGSGYGGFDGRQLPDFGNNGGSDNSGNGSGNNNSGNGSDDGQNGSGSDSSSSENDGPKLGVTVETVSNDMVSSGYPAGVLIRKVTSGSPADKAGLKAGDIITSFNGTVVKSTDELVEQVQNVNAGDTVRVVYKRLENEQYKAENADVKMAASSSSSSGSSNS